MDTQDMYDFVVAGGGQAGCVLASRLSHALPSMTVALIEAGPDAHADPRVADPLACASLHRTELEWNYETVPQAGMAGRRVYNCGGRLLSGGTGVNYGGWTRGHAADFDEWGAMVKDERWSYKGLLPFFRKAETHYAAKEERGEHGFEGPVHTMPRVAYPLDDTIRAAFAEAGVRHVADANSGDPEGLAAWTQNWRDGARQAAGQAYDLSRVHVVTDTTVHRVVFDADETSRATGVQLVGGRTVRARREVVVCCGALRTPQVLLLSGVGGAEQLAAAGIAQAVDAPGVGRNLHDHPSIVQYFRLKNPEKGLAMGSAAFGAPKYGPTGWVLTASAPAERLGAALTKDGVDDVRSHSSLASRRMHYETVTVYAPMAVPADYSATVAPFDGSIISTGSICLLPTSRGSVTLASADPTADPVIDPAYLSTEHDVAILRAAMRQTSAAMGTAAAAEVVGEWLPDGVEVDTGDATDAQLDSRIRPFAASWYHPAGTAAMGSVVDGECRVHGAKGLRLLDASVIPTPIAAHLQATVYAMAEQVSDMMVSAYT